MTRGGASKTRGEPERRCIATGGSGPVDRLVRFVLGPGAEVVPDLAARLPGRGVWLTADRALVEKAVAKRLFARAFRAPATAPGDLADQLEELLARRLIEIIGLARKAGQAVTGFEKVRARLKEGAVGVLLEASDGAADGRAKLARLIGEVPGGAPGKEPGGVPVIGVLDSAELGLAFGRDFAIHAALDRGDFAECAFGEATRLSGLRSGGPIRNEMRGAAAPASNGRQEKPAAASGQGDR